MSQYWPLPYHPSPLPLLLTQPLLLLVVVPMMPLLLLLVRAMCSLVLQLPKEVRSRQQMETWGGGRQNLGWAPLLPGAGRDETQEPSTLP